MSLVKSPPILWLVTLLVLTTLAVGAPTRVELRATVRSRDLSFRNEIQHSIDTGLTWLKAGQNSDGWWSTPGHPAVTALALAAFMGEPAGRYKTNTPTSLAKGYEFILGLVKPDGSIYRTALTNYNTSVSMMALLAADNPAYDNILRQARNFLVKSQVDLDASGKVDSAFDGGVGCGDQPPYSDLNSTLAAVEAIYYTRYLVADKRLPDTRELNWNGLVHFVQNCQNLPGYNKQPWASGDPKNKGGFIYYPGHSIAGTETNAATGRVTPRSYGSVTYAGLLSYTYANLKRQDPRIVATLNWLRSNYSVEENPGLGQQDFFYCLYVMTKALNTSGANTLKLKDGREIEWRREVATRLINLQQHDGSWANANARWPENDPSLVTAYAVLSLEIIWRGI